MLDSELDTVALVAGTSVACSRDRDNAVALATAVTTAARPGISASSQIWTLFGEHALANPLSKAGHNLGTLLNPPGSWNSHTHRDVPPLRSRHCCKLNVLCIELSCTKLDATCACLPTPRWACSEPRARYGVRESSQHRLMIEQALCTQNHISSASVRHAIAAGLREFALRTRFAPSKVAISAGALSGCPWSPVD